MRSTQISPEMLSICCHFLLFPLPLRHRLQTLTPNLPIVGANSTIKQLPIKYLIFTTFPSEDSNVGYDYCNHTTTGSTLPDWWQSTLTLFEK